MRLLELLEGVSLLGKFRVGYGKPEMPSDMKKNVPVGYVKLVQK